MANFKLNRFFIDVTVQLVGHIVENKTLILGRNDKKPIY